MAAAELSRKLLLRRLAKLKDKSPAGYAAAVHVVAAAYARKGKPLLVGETEVGINLADAAGFDPSKLLDLLEGIIKLMPSILKAIQSIIDLFS